MGELNLAQRMLAVASEITSIQKDVTVKHFGANYEGLSHDGVVTAVRKSMITHGVLAVPSVIDQRHSEAITQKGNVQQMIDVTVETTFINADKMDERISVITVGTGIDSQDKAPGKAMSYAKKYGLLYAFLLVTGENDEARPNTDGGGVTRKQQDFKPLSMNDKFNFGKHKGKMVGQVCGSDEEYIHWLIDDAKKKGKEIFTKDVHDWLGGEK